MDFMRVKDEVFLLYWIYIVSVMYKLINLDIIADEIN